MKQKGFTLVELSIVLVIIGLLIGGILAAQSMIETARINSFVRQIQQYDTAVSNFQTKYNSLPGDSTAFGCTNSGYTACNNGLIEGLYGTLYSNFSFAAETAKFWPQLQQGGFTYGANQPFTATVPAGGINSDSNNPNLPTIRGSIDGAVAAGYCNMFNNAPIYTNCWEMGNWKGGSAGLTASAASAIFTPEIALAVDTKMDDGLPQTGSVRNWSGTTAPNGYSNTDLDLCAAPGTSKNSGVTNKYQTKNTGNVCILSIGLLSQIGQTQ